MIHAAAFVPGAPLLVPEVSGRGHHDVTDVLDASVRAVTRAAEGGARLVLLGAGDDAPSARHPGSARGSLRGFGAEVEYALDGSAGDGPAVLPVALTVGAWLCHAAGVPRVAAGFSVGDDWAASDARLRLADDAEPTALVVVGDGSARRGVKAPGYLDERAAGFDAAVASALARGDAGALAGLDPALGRELLAAGVLAWRAAGALLAGRRWRAELLAERDPFGVDYLVACWTAG